MSTKKEDKYLACEKDWVYYLLICIAGFWGAFTYLLRGHVFCNAQTGNMVLLGLALGEGEWRVALYYLIPLSAYLLGAFISELVPNSVKRKLPMRWDTLLIIIEMCFVVFLGLIPESAPVQISQIAINFIASMQYNTFRQAEGIPVATTFITNHVRQIGVGLAKCVKHIFKKNPDKSYRIKLRKHFLMFLFFIVGVTIGTVFCNILNGKAILLTLIPFAVILIYFLHADLLSDKEEMEKKPLGH